MIAEVFDKLYIGEHYFCTYSIFQQLKRLLCEGIFPYRVVIFGYCSLNTCKEKTVQVFVAANMYILEDTFLKLHSIQTLEILH